MSRSAPDGGGGGSVTSGGRVGFGVGLVVGEAVGANVGLEVGVDVGVGVIDAVDAGVPAAVVVVPPATVVVVVVPAVPAIVVVVEAPVPAIVVVDTGGAVVVVAAPVEVVPLDTVVVVEDTVCTDVLTGTVSVGRVGSWPGARVSADPVWRFVDTPDGPELQGKTRESDKRCENNQLGGCTRQWEIDTYLAATSRSHACLASEPVKEAQSGEAASVRGEEEKKKRRRRRRI